MSRHKAEKKHENWAIRLLKETVFILAGAVILSVILRTFVIAAFYIPSGSMEQTLGIGDRILALRLVPDVISVKRGDIVVFKDTEGWLPDNIVRPQTTGFGNQVLKLIGLVPDDSQDHLIKRVIGLPGDTVACCTPEGQLTVNDEPIDEPYLYPGDAPSESPFTATVPAGHLWVMGDHRSNSDDSRANQDSPSHGFVSLDDVVGRAWLVTWPADKFGLVESESSVFAGVPKPTATSPSP